MKASIGPKTILYPAPALVVGTYDGDGKPNVMTAAIEGTNFAYKEDHRPTTNLHLPAADEASLGQFFQMMMLTRERHRP